MADVFQAPGITLSPPGVRVAACADEGNGGAFLDGGVGQNSAISSRSLQMKADAQCFIPEVICEHGTCTVPSMEWVDFCPRTT
jgi:hypothetical protein